MRILSTCVSFQSCPDLLPRPPPRPIPHLPGHTPVRCNAPRVEVYSISNKFEFQKKQQKNIFVLCVTNQSFSLSLLLVYRFICLKAAPHMDLNAIFSYFETIFCCVRETECRGALLCDSAPLNQTKGGGVDLLRVNVDRKKNLRYSQVSPFFRLSPSCGRFPH